MASPMNHSSQATDSEDFQCPGAMGIRPGLGQSQKRERR